MGNLFNISQVKAKLSVKSRSREQFMWYLMSFYYTKYSNKIATKIYGILWGNICTYNIRALPILPQSNYPRSWKLRCKFWTLYFFPEVSLITFIEIKQRLTSWDILGLKTTIQLESSHYVYVRCGMVAFADLEEGSLLFSLSVLKVAIVSDIMSHKFSSLVYDLYHCLGIVFSEAVHRQYFFWYIWAGYARRWYSVSYYETADVWVHDMKRFTDLTSTITSHSIHS